LKSEEKSDGRLQMAFFREISAKLTTLTERQEEFKETPYGRENNMVGVSEHEHN